MGGCAVFVCPNQAMHAVGWVGLSTSTRLLVVLRNVGRHWQHNNYRSRFVVFFLFFPFGLVGLVCFVYAGNARRECLARNVHSQSINVYIYVSLVFPC